MIENIVQNLIFGILLGALYGLVALGLSMVFGVTRFLNVAHGELLMIGGYISFWAFQLFKVDPFLSIPITLIGMFVFGLIIYRLVFSRMVKLPEGKKIQSSLLVAFGLSLILQNLAQILWTADLQGITTDYSNIVFTVFGIRFPIIKVASLATALVLFLVVYLFLQKTYIGKAIRATVQDWEAATLMGINIQKMYLISFAIGSALAGVAGTLVCVNYTIEPTMGLMWTLKALVVLVLGGFGSISGTLVGGLILGLTESVTSIVIPGGSNYREIVSLILFVLILILRPQGLFGKKEG
jgi:branched-chain amino acid transport system permease protein